MKNHILILLFTLFSLSSNSQTLDSIFNTLKFRNIGPFRGGRSNAGSGVNGDPLTYYMTTTGGGVWKTTDAGQHWRNISDGFFKSGSVGAISVSSSDPNTIYHAGNVVFKTQNGGIDWEVISPDLTRNDKTKQGPGGTPFTNEAAGGENYNTLMSLVASTHNPDVLWAGSDDGLIHLTQDGGETWNNVTPKKMEEGIVNSLEVSPHNPAKAYAVLMRYKFMDLTPYVYKTEDYGANWD